MKPDNSSGISGFFDVFLSKLKEQSFVIVLMLGVIYFQHKMFTERIAHHEAIEDRQEALIDRMNEDRQKLDLEREKYLTEQRDKYVEEALNILKK
jgi:hypothetical protein